MTLRGFAILAAMLALLGCGPGVGHYEAVIDGLGIPSEWELAHTTVRRPGGPDEGIEPGRPRDEIGCAQLFGNCPAVARYYLVPAASAIDAYREAKEIVTRGGFNVDEEFFRDCDRLSDSAVCTFYASKAGDFIQVAVHEPGDDTEGLGIASLDRAIVRVTARGDR